MHLDSSFWKKKRMNQTEKRKLKRKKNLVGKGLETNCGKMLLETVSGENSMETDCTPMARICWQFAKKIKIRSRLSLQFWSDIEHVYWLQRYSSLIWQRTIVSCNWCGTCCAKIIFLKEVCTSFRADCDCIVSWMGLSILTMCTRTLLFLYRHKAFLM